MYFIEYRILRNQMIRTVNSIRSSYYRDQIHNFRIFDPHSWWKHTQSLTCPHVSLCVGNLNHLA